MRLIDADELIEHAWRDKLDSRELIAQMIATAPTVKEIPTKIPINVFEWLISQKPFDIETYCKEHFMVMVDKDLWEKAEKALKQEPKTDSWSIKDVADTLAKHGLIVEQKTILDQIRAEIEENAYPILHGVNSHEKGMSLYGILQIIDKYKAEVEPQENRCADCNHYDVCMSHMKVR